MQMPRDVTAAGSGTKRDGMARAAAGSGGTNGSSLGTEFPWPLVILLWGATLAFGVVNATSTSDELRGAGVAFEWWEPWLWEGTSMVAWAGLIPAIAIAAMRFSPPRLRWQRMIAPHLLLSVVVSALHVAVMVALRETVYSAGGARYGFDWGAGNLLYEYRKDALSYALIAGAILVWKFAVRPVDSAAPDIAFRLEVRDGARLRFLAPQEVEAVSAAGNYAELHLADGTAILHRATLASLEAILAPHGFVRVHRSHLVRPAAVREIGARAAGDFELALASGRRIPGSRRHREAIGRTPPA
jgi:hypothetical protein